MAVDGAEQRTVADARTEAPRLDGRDGAGVAIPADGERHATSFTFLVGLQAADGHDDAFVAALEVADVDADQLAAPERPGEPHEQQCSVSGPDQRVGEVGKHRAEIAERQRRGLSRRSAERPSDPRGDRPHVLVRGR